MPLLAAIQHNVLEQIEQSDAIRTRLRTQGLVAERTDAEICEAARLIAQIDLDPTEAVPLARVAGVHLSRALSLGSITVEHREAASLAASAIQMLCHATIARLHAHWGGSGPEKGDAA
jgi:hypothetical protein